MMPERIDVLIITPLAEERQAVLSKLGDYKRLPPSSLDVQVYFSANLGVKFPNGKKGSYRVIVTSPAGMGRVQATSLVSDAMVRWSPSYVILVGIAGGFNLDGVGGVSLKGIRLGDVIIADKVVDYEFQKLRSDETDIRWQVYPVDQRMLNVAQHFLYSDWHKNVNILNRPLFGDESTDVAEYGASGDDLMKYLDDILHPKDGFDLDRMMREARMQESLRETLPKVHFGQIASGDKVIAYDDAMKYERRMWSQLIGVEMEAGGVALKLLQTVERPGFFMVRSVSDFADARKNTSMIEQWRTYACDVAATYAIELLKTGPFPLA